MVFDCQPVFQAPQTRLHEHKLVLFKPKTEVAGLRLEQQDLWTPQILCYKLLEPLGIKGEAQETLCFTKLLYL